METSNKTARELYEEIKAKPTRPRFGFGRKPVVVNVDLQKSYTCVDEFKTAYKTDPKQLDYVNEISGIARSKNIPVVWTYVAYMESGEDCGICPADCSGSEGPVCGNGVCEPGEDCTLASCRQDCRGRKKRTD